MLQDGRAAEEEISSVFGPDGSLARAMPGFEHRLAQVRMATAIWQAFASGRTILIEAGTGTGKSLAYLYPGLRRARIAGTPLIVSTNTINLQEQLLAKDLPILARLVEAPPKAALLLGRQNYLCRRRFEAVRLRGTELAAAELAELGAAIEDGRGDRGELGKLVPEGFWPQLASDGELCLRQRCPHASSCFWQRARRAAAEAEIVVVNHHLLLADVAIRAAQGWETDFAALPAYESVICDEAHHLEDIATGYFSITLSERETGRILDRLYRKEGPAQLGVLPLCGLGMPTAGPALDPGRLADARALALQAIGETEGARARAAALFQILAGLARSRGGRDGQVWQWRYCQSLTASLPELAGAAEDLRVALAGLNATLGRLLMAWEGENAEAPLTEEGTIAKAAKDFLDRFQADLPRVLAAQEDDRAYWLALEHSRGRLEASAVMAPLQVGPVFYQAFLAHLRGAVFTSATLTAGGAFTFFKERLGLDLIHPGERRELILASPFDYRRQVLLAVPADMPDPDAPSFPSHAAAFLSKLLHLTGGRTLVLFTSFAALEKVAALLRELLPSGVRLLCQGDAPRSELLADFKRDEGAVLFGTDSFWEGVDVPGLALSCVVLARLPFRVPTEPLTEARTEWLARQGIDPFAAYTLPQAVIKFKQGFGRLVRRQDDTGAVVVMDARLLARKYGRYFRAALPECAECFAPSARVLDEVGEWIGRNAKRQETKAGQAESFVHHSVAE